jgi:hypothetical protein
MSVCFYPELQISLMTLRLAALSPLDIFLRGRQRAMASQLLNVAQRTDRHCISSMLTPSGAATEHKRLPFVHPFCLFELILDLVDGLEKPH